jgi:hypothetical protein
MGYSLLRLCSRYANGQCNSVSLRRRESTALLPSKVQTSKYATMVTDLVHSRCTRWGFISTFTQSTTRRSAPGDATIREARTITELSAAVVLCTSFRLSVRRLYSGWCSQLDPRSEQDATRLTQYTCSPTKTGYQDCAYEFADERQRSHHIPQPSPSSRHAISLLICTNSNAVQLCKICYFCTLKCIRSFNSTVSKDGGQHVNHSIQCIALYL